MRIAANRTRDLPTLLVLRQSLLPGQWPGRSFDPRKHSPVDSSFEQSSEPRHKMSALSFGESAGYLSRHGTGRLGDNAAESLCRAALGSADLIRPERTSQL